MKKFILVGLTILLLAGSIACTPVIQTVTSAESQAEITELTGQLSQLQTDYSNLQNKYQTDFAGTQGQIDDLNKNLALLQSNYDTLQQSYNSLINSAGQSGLRNPTWAEIKTFLSQDKTDKTPYDLKTFACSGYAITVRDHARNLGMRAAYIQIELPGSAGHAFNAFETTDKGLIYIDCTEGDKVAYVKVGQVYGTIGIDAVKTEYIACDVSPADFWHPLTYKTAAHPFSYDYYLDYQARRDFYNKTIDAFNAAVSQYNNRTGQWTSAQLDTWRSNIGALSQDLGNVLYQPLGVVGNIETYWGD
jgi:hypothetical protein